MPVGHAVRPRRLPPTLPRPRWSVGGDLAWRDSALGRADGCSRPMRLVGGATAPRGTGQSERAYRLGDKGEAGIPQWAAAVPSASAAWIGRQLWLLLDAEAAVLVSTPS